MPRLRGGPAVALTTRARVCVATFAVLRIAAKGPDAHELGTFWLRKSKKPVLSVLMVQRRGHDGRRKKPEFYRGMNMEVSMPTGSLCAERNVIGTALASDMTVSDLFCVLAEPRRAPDPLALVRRLNL